MKKHVLNFLSIMLLGLLIACSSPEEASLADTTTNDDISIEITSRSLEADFEEAEDRDLLLVKRWEAENGYFLDLKIDGSFEGQLDDDLIILGNWDISNDDHILTLTAAAAEEGKGKSLNSMSYSILDMSSNKMIIQGADGQKISFSASK